MADNLKAWWQGLADRERRLVSWGALAVALVVVWVLLWEPAMLGIRKLDADLPQLRQQDAAMRAMADEAARLRAAGISNAPIAADARLAAVRRSLERAGLGETRVAATPAGANAAAAPVLSLAGTVPQLTAAAPTRIDPPEVVAEAEGRVRVRFADIDYGVWVAWLAATESELSARAIRVSVGALAPNAPVGHVRADALLDWTAPPAAGAGGARP